MDAIDSRMIHYIFIGSAHLTTLWDISAAKSWINDARDATLTYRVAELKDSKDILNFLARFPQYFFLGLPEFNFGFVRVHRQAVCPHCGQLAILHTEKGIGAARTAAPQTVPSVTHLGFTASSSGGPSSPQSSTQPYSFIHPTAPSCSLSSSTQISSTPPSSTPPPSTPPLSTLSPSTSPFSTPPSSLSQSSSQPSHTCAHDDLFRAAYHLRSNCPAQPLDFQSSLVVLLKSRNQTIQAELIRKMTKKQFKKCMVSLKPKVFEVHCKRLILAKGSDCACPCLKSSSSDTRTASSIPPTPFPLAKPASSPSASSPYPSSATSSLSNLSHSASSTCSSSPAAASSSTPKLSSTTSPSPPPVPTFLSTSSTTIAEFNVGLVQNWEQCVQAVQYISNFTQLAVNCEGVNLSDTGKLCLVQIGVISPGDELFTFLFDIIALEKTAQFKQVCDSLASIMQDDSKVKIMHDGRQDCSFMFHQLSISVNKIFDTQVGYRALCEVKRGTTSYDPTDSKRIGLNALLRKYSFPINPFKDAIQARMDKNGSQFWSVRPLPNDLIQYMVHEVASLIPLRTKLIDDMQQWVCKSAEALSFQNSRSFIDESNFTHIPTPYRLLELTFSPEYRCLYRETEEDEDTENQKLKDEDFLLDKDTLTLVCLLPARVGSRVVQTTCEVKRSLIEIVMDHERPITLRFSDIDDIHLEDEANMPESMKSLSEGISGITGIRAPVSFMSDNRLGISKMLHRVSAIRSRSGEVIGLTYRIGRNIEGVSYMIKDIIAKVAGHGGQKPRSVLLLGRPGVGKTTVLREVACLLSTEFKRRVVVVDTSNEIAGDGDVPHPCIGQSRRVQVPHRDEQHSILIETVQNHNPHVIIVDEIGTSKEVEAVRTITQRGVSMVGTAHGEDLHTLLKNPTLIGLIGGIQQVILSAAEAKIQNKDKNGVYKKTRLERAGAPTFEMVIELRERHKWRVHTNVAEVVDKLLADMDPLVETRMSAGNRKIHSMFSNERAKEDWFENLKQCTV